MKKFLLVIFLFAANKFLFAQNTWEKVASYGGGERQRAVAFSIGGRGYVGTGVDTADQVRKDFWEYDPGTDSWTQKADFMGSARRDAVGFAIGNHGYIGTGMNNVSSAAGSKQKDLYEYNPVTNSWTQKANMPGGGVYFACAFATSSKGYVCCGKVGASSYSKSFYQYDPSADTWSQLANFPGGVRYGMTAFAIGDVGYVGCGADENYYCKDFWEYDPSTGTWTQHADFAGSARFNAVGFTLDSHGYFSCGTDGGYQKDLWEYYPEFDYWMQKSDLPGGGRRAAIAFTISSKAYVGTGKGDGTKRSVYRYTPSAWSPFQSDDAEERTRSSFISPNPVRDQARIFVQETSSGEEGILTVINEEGKIVFTSNEFSSSAFSFSGKNLPTGIYYYEVEMKDRQGLSSTSAGKFLIQ